MTWAITSYELSKKGTTETRTVTNTLIGPESTTVTKKQQTRSRTITVTRYGPYTQSDANSAMMSSDTTNSTGAGTITSSNKTRANRAGMYYVDVTVDVRTAWSDS